MAIYENGDTHSSDWATHGDYTVPAAQLASSATDQPSSPTYSGLRPQPESKGLFSIDHFDPYGAHNQQYGQPNNSEYGTSAGRSTVPQMTIHQIHQPPLMNHNPYHSPHHIQPRNSNAYSTNQHYTQQTQQNARTATEVPDLPNYGGLQSSGTRQPDYQTNAYVHAINRNIYQRFSGATTDSTAIVDTMTGRNGKERTSPDHQQVQQDLESSRKRKRNETNAAPNDQAAESTTTPNKKSKMAARKTPDGPSSGDATDATSTQVATVKQTSTSSVASYSSAANAAASVPALPTPANTAAAVMAATKAKYPTVDTNAVGNITLAAARGITMVVKPLILAQQDDWRLVQLNKRTWISRMLNSLNANWQAISSIPAFQHHELQPEWDTWQVESFETMMKAIREGGDAQFAEARMTILFETVMEAHETTGNPNAGPYRIGSAAANHKLRCSERLMAITQAMTSICLVREDVIKGKLLHELAADPRAFAKRKESNKHGNELKKRKYAHLRPPKKTKKTSATAQAADGGDDDGGSEGAGSGEAAGGGGQTVRSEEVDVEEADDEGLDGEEGDD